MLPAAKIFLILGIVFIVVSGLLFLAARLGIVPFRLPGDIRIEGSNFTCLIGLGTSILLSIVLTVLLNLLLRWLGK
jgi:hypothetical protein